MKMETKQNRQETGTRSWAMLFIILIATGVAMAGATRQFTFNNNTGRAANDLHIEFKQAVEPVAGATGNYGPFPNAQGSGTSKVDFDGGTVVNGGSASIKFKTGSSKITIKKWWWTRDGVRIGHVHTRLAAQVLPLDAHFYQLDWLAEDLTPLWPDSAVGEMALEFDGTEAAFLADNGGAYVNVVIQSAMPSLVNRPQWIVQNLYLAYPDHEHMANSSPTVQFRLPVQNGEDVQDMWVGLAVSDQPAVQFPWVQVQLVPVWDRPYLTGGFAGGGSALSSLPIMVGPWVGALPDNWPVAWAWTWQAADGIAAVNEDINGCAPASAARSIAYLGAAHGFQTENAQAIYDDLYDDMDTDEDGTADADMLSGKNKYTGDNDLPIETELVYGMEHLDDVMDAINAGADVEILISWDPNGGHAAMITSVTKFADGSYEITYVDDPTQGDGEAENEEHTIHVQPDGSFPGGRVDGFMVERVPALDLFERDMEEIWSNWFDGCCNGTGSLIGHEEYPYLETEIVHSGRQSLPFYYDNSAQGSDMGGNSPGTFSVIQREFDQPQDWATSDVNGNPPVLSLWTYGNIENAPEPLFAFIHDGQDCVAAVCHPNPQILGIAEWTPWCIEVSEFAEQCIDLSDIRTLALAVGHPEDSQPGGHGMVLVDTIELRGGSCGDRKHVRFIVSFRQGCMT